MFILPDSNERKTREYLEQLTQMMTASIEAAARDGAFKGYSTVVEACIGNCHFLMNAMDQTAMDAEFPRLVEAASRYLEMFKKKFEGKMNVDVSEKMIYNALKADAAIEDHSTDKKIITDLSQFNRKKQF